MESFTKVDLELLKNHFRVFSDDGAEMRMFDTNARFWLHRENINLDKVKAMFRFLGDAKDLIIPKGNHKGLYLFSERKNLCYKYEASMTKH